MRGAGSGPPPAGQAPFLSTTAGGATGIRRYYPFGGMLAASGSMVTDKLFTGHQQEDALYFMQSRFYDPAIGRFLPATAGRQPDAIVPDPMNPQSLNRYSYVLNNPLRYTDPTGHCIGGLPCFGDVAECVANALNCVRDPIASWSAAGSDALASAWLQGSAHFQRFLAQSQAAAMWAVGGTIALGQAILSLPPVEFIVDSISGVPGFVTKNWKEISRAIQFADALPTSLVPVVDLPVSIGLDLAGFSAAQIDIAMSKCGVGTVAQATATNLLNLGVGVVVNVATTAIELTVVGIAVSIPISLAGSLVEAKLYELNRDRLSNC